MIDLHCHLVPGIDDGPATLSDAADLCRQAWADGIRVAVATPHAFTPAWSPEPGRIVEGVARLAARLADEGIGLRVLPGMEAHLHPDLARDLSEGRALPLGDSRAVLVELPWIELPHYAEPTLFAIQAAGFRPVIAHPERNVGIQKDPARFAAMVGRGIGGVLNGASLTGRFGSEARRVAEILLRDGLIDAVATDAHDPVTRPAVLSRAVGRLAEIVGAERARWLVTGGPARVLGLADAEWAS